MTLSMTLERIFIAISFSTLFAITSCGQIGVTIPKEFVETVPPKPESDEWFPLNYSQNEFGVKIIDGKLDVKKVREVDKLKLQVEPLLE